MKDSHLGWSKDTAIGTSERPLKCRLPYYSYDDEKYQLLKLKAPSEDSAICGGSNFSKKKLHIPSSLSMRLGNIRCMYFWEQITQSTHLFTATIEKLWDHQLKRVVPQGQLVTLLSKNLVGNAFEKTVGVPSPSHLYYAHLRATRIEPTQTSHLSIGGTYAMIYGEEEFRGAR